MVLLVEGDGPLLFFEDAVDRILFPLIFSEVPVTVIGDGHLA